MRDKAAPAVADGPPAIVPAPRLAPSEASRRWAALLQQIFEVDPLACPSCHGTMRVVAFLTQASVIDQILTHLRSRAAHAVARSPDRCGPPRAGSRHAPHARPPMPRLPHEYAPATPRDVRRARRSHRGVRLVPAVIRPRTVTAVLTALTSLTAHE